MTTGLIRSWWQYNDNNDKVDDDEKWLCGKLMGVQDFHQTWPPIIVSPRSMSLLLNGKNGDGDHGDGDDDDDDHGGDDEYNHHDDYASWHWWCLGARLWGNVCWSDKVSLLRLKSTIIMVLLFFLIMLVWSLWVEIISVKIITLMIIMMIMINQGAHTSGCKESRGGG